MSSHAAVQHKSSVVQWLELLEEVAKSRPLAQGLHSLQVSPLLDEVARDFRCSNSSSAEVHAVERVYGTLAMSCRVSVHAIYPRHSSPDIFT